MTGEARGLACGGSHFAFQFAGKGHDLRDVATKLGVKSVLEGSVRRAGNRLRVNAQLINASDGFHLWSERFDRDMDDVFAVQDEIARSVTETLKVKLLGEPDAPMVTRPTENLEAYHLYLKGRHYHSRATGPALERSVECFTQALAIEPGYAQAHAGIASVQALRAVLGFVAPMRAMPLARESADKALAIDESVADAHFALAFVLDYDEWNWTGAEREYRRALELNPGDALARSFYADMLCRVRRFDAGIAEARRAVEQDPLSALSRHLLALALYMAKRFEASIAEAQAGVDLEPSFPFLHSTLGWAFGALGRHQEAIEAHKHAATIAPGDPLPTAHLGRVLGLAGQKQEALAILDDLEQRKARDYCSEFLMAHVNLGLGDTEQAIARLERAASDRDPLLCYLDVWYPLDPLRADPRFQALLRRMNFPETAAES